MSPTQKTTRRGTLVQYLQSPTAKVAGSNKTTNSTGCWSLSLGRNAPTGTAAPSSARSADAQDVNEPPRALTRMSVSAQSRRSLNADANDAQCSEATSTNRLRARQSSVCSRTCDSSNGPDSCSSSTCRPRQRRLKNRARELRVRDTLQTNYTVQRHNLVLVAHQLDQSTDSPAATMYSTCGLAAMLLTAHVASSTRRRKQDPQFFLKCIHSEILKF